MEILRIIIIAMFALFGGVSAYFFLYVMHYGIPDEEDKYCDDPCRTCAFSDCPDDYYACQECGERIITRMFSKKKEVPKK